MHAIGCERSQSADNQESCYWKDWNDEKSCDQTVNWYDQGRSVDLREAKGDSLQTRSSG